VPRSQAVADRTLARLDAPHLPELLFPPDGGTGVLDGDRRLLDARLPTLGTVRLERDEAVRGRDDAISAERPRHVRATPSSGRRRWRRGRELLRLADRVEAVLVVRAVAEGLVLRTAAPAEGEGRPASQAVRAPLPVHDLELPF